MDPKPRPNHRQYLQTLRAMTPAQRFQVACDLSDMARRLFRQGLRQRFPELSEADLHRVYLERLAKCHNQNW